MEITKTQTESAETAATTPIAANNSAKPTEGFYALFWNPSFPPPADRTVSGPVGFEALFGSGGGLKAQDLPKSAQTLEINPPPVGTTSSAADLADRLFHPHSKPHHRKENYDPSTL